MHNRLFSLPLAICAAAAFAASADFTDDLEEARRQLTDMHNAPFALAGSLRSRGLTDDEALSVLDYILEHPGEFPRHAAGNAVSAMGFLGTEQAFLHLGTFLDSDDESLRWRATKALQDMAFSRQFSGFDPVERFKTTVNGPLSHGAEIRHTVHYGFDMALTYSAPEPPEQARILRFLLDESAVDSANAAQLDAILCREVPKWRASRQRAENAAKMIREHPDDARLVAFFETVRTNAIESARTALFPERAGCYSPAATNPATRASAPPPADSDPWADLLDDLPEKKPWTPPLGCEPPF